MKEAKYNLPNYFYFSYVFYLFSTVLFPTGYSVSIFIGRCQNNIMFSRIYLITKRAEPMQIFHTHRTWRFYWLRAIQSRSVERSCGKVHWHLTIFTDKYITFLIHGSSRWISVCFTISVIIKKLVSLSKILAWY